MNTTTKAQRTNKRQDAIWEKAKRASEMTDEEHEQLQARKTAGAQGCAYVPPADKTAHTPGPWTIGSRGFDDLLRIEGPDFRALAYVRDEENESANARLIAAAPDLLFACKRAIEEMHGNPREGWDAVQGCMDAIAKAEGQ